MAAIAIEAQSIINRLAAVDRAHPVLDRARANAAIAEHFRVLGLLPLPVRWVDDAEVGYAIAMSATRSAAWRQAVMTARATAESNVNAAAWSAAWSAARVAADTVAETTVAESYVDAAVWSVMSAARAAAWSAADAAVSAARTAADTAADTAAVAVGHYSAIWLPFVDATEAGLWLFWVLEQEILAVERPALQIVDGRLHCDDGPAVAWPNGTRYWFVHGVQVNEQIVMEPAALTVSEITNERNAEVRRVMLERFGEARYLQECGAQLIHRDDWGALYRTELVDDEPLVMVKVVNASPEQDGSYRDYFLRVHPDLRPLLPGGGMGKPQRLTAHNAVASTFGLCGSEYAPQVQS